MKKGSMRDQMPIVTALIDDLRATFGKEMIDGQIRSGINGQPTFWASENGHTVGTKMPEPRASIVYVNGTATVRTITGSGE